MSIKSKAIAGIFTFAALFFCLPVCAQYFDSKNPRPVGLPTAGVTGQPGPGGYNYNPAYQANPGYGYNPAYGQYPYANQPGYGYYTGSPYGSYYPALGAPVPVNGGYFRFNVGGFSGSYWKAPSGYYYPFGAGAVYATPPPVIVVQQGASQVVQPQVTDMLKDMYAFVEDQNTKKKYKTDDYQHLARRIRDLQNLESQMRNRNNGTLDPQDEEKLRKDCAMLSGDISRRVIP